MNTTNRKNKNPRILTRLMHEYDKFKLSVLLFFKGIPKYDIKLCRAITAYDARVRQFQTKGLSV